MRPNYRHPLVSVSILTYNGEHLPYNSQKYIENCLGSVFAQTYPYLEVIIIDNNSIERTKDYLKKISDKFKVRSFFNSSNLGLCVGHNQGIKKSKGEYVLCLNQDAVLDKNFISRAVESFNKDSQIATIQGKLMQEEGKKIDTTGLMMLKTRRVISRGQGQTDKGQFEKQEEIFGADGAAPIYRRKALEDIKLVFKRNDQWEEEYLDEDFFMYKDDVDLAWRMRLYGWKTVYQPKCLAWHSRTSGESASLNYFDIIRERRKIGGFAKYFSFKNHRLVLIKNDQLQLLIKHLPWFLFNEIGAWGYALLFERRTWQAIRKLFQQAPLAWQKRKIIMTKKRVEPREIARWFN